MPKKTELDIYTASLRGDDHTVRQFTAWAKRYINYSEGRMDRQTVLNWLKNLERRGFADGTMNLAFRIVKRLFESNGVEWPFGRGEAPKIRQSDVFAPALHPDLIRKIIQSAIAGKLDSNEAAVITLGVIYGVRRTEIADLKPEDIRDDLILVRTAKHGFERWHKLPKVIRPYVAGWPGGFTTDQITRFYLMAEYKADIPHITGVGIHSIRRTLDTLLLRVLPEMVVSVFLRWRRPGMAQRYFATRFVGLGEDKMEIEDKAGKADDEVFEVHPFLKEYR